MLSNATLDRVDRVIKIARSLKPEKAIGKPFHVTACYRKSKLIALGWNDYRHFHPAKRFGVYTGFKRSKEKYIAGRHSEIAAVLNCGHIDFSDIVFINVRINNNNQVDMSKPCPNCLRTLSEQIGFKSIIYTNADGTIGIIKS
jgi:deoxycytidylate deaminase